MAVLAALLAAQALAVDATWVGGSGNWDIAGVNNNWVTNGVVGWDPDANADSQGDGTDDVILAGTNGATITLNIEYYRAWNFLRSVVITATNTFYVNRNNDKACTVTNWGTLQYNPSMQLPGTVYNTGRVIGVRASTINSIGGGTVEIPAGTSFAGHWDGVPTLIGGTFTNNGTFYATSQAEGGHPRLLMLTNVTAVNNGLMLLSCTANYSGANRVLLAGTTTCEHNGSIAITNLSTSSGDTFFIVYGNATLTTASNSAISVARSAAGSGNDAYLGLEASAIPFTNNGAIAIANSAAGSGSAQLRSSRDVVNAGRLAVGGTNASVVMSGGATLTVAGGGILEPGLTNAVGTMSVTGNVTLATGAICRWDYLNATGDLVNVAGTLTLPAAATVSVTSLGGDLPDPAVVMRADAIAGTTDLSGWSVQGLIGYRCKVRNNEVWVFKASGTVILLR